MFEYLTAAPADPILGLADLYNKDERTNKINLSVGVYKDETTKTPILESVKKAEQFLLTDETTKSYLPIDGSSTFNDVTQTLLFANKNERARTAQV